MLNTLIVRRRRLFRPVCPDRLSRVRSGGNASAVATFKRSAQMPKVVAEYLGII